MSCCAIDDEQPSPMRPAGPDQMLTFFFRVHGRIGRTEYALGLGFIYAVYLAIIAFALVHAELTPAATFFLVLLALPLVVGLAVIMAKRCHDLGLPGVYFLLLLVPLAGFVWLIALAFLPGNPGPNLYGAPPAFEPEQV